jgi:hypothetical protein
MRWMIKMDGVSTGETWDDGVWFPTAENERGPGPGEEGFTTDLISAELARRSTGKSKIKYTADFASVSWPPTTSVEPTEPANDEPQN